MTSEGPAARPVPGVRAAIDCGTNSTRLLVVGPGDEALAREIRITRLGEGVDEHHRLAGAAIERTLDVLREYRAVMDARHVERARLVATSAVRDAANREEFLEAAGHAAGVVAELLTGTEEGALAYRGAVGGLGPGAGDDVVVDVGGGSTELVAAAGGQPRVISLDIGCVRLTERCFLHDPPLPEEVADAAHSVEDALAHAERALLELRRRGSGRRLIGLAGTVATLSMLEQGLAAYQRERVHGSVLTLACVERWCEVLAGESSADRLTRPGLMPGREDVILAGALVLRQVMRRFGFERCVVSEADILDGLVASLRP